MLRHWIASALMVSVVTTAAQAQPQRGQPQRGQRGGQFGFGGIRISGDGLVFLASVSEIQKELSVTAEQKELLDALSADLRDQTRGLFRGGPGGGQGGGGQGNQGPGQGQPGTNNGLEQFQARMQNIVRRVDELLTTVLEPEQIQRLKQLQLQREGIRALDRPEFVKSLNLTEEQLEQIKKLRGQPAPGRGAENNPSAQPADAPRESVESQVLAVLTEEQKEAWNTQKGKPFEFPESLIRPFGRGSSGRGGNPPGRP
jgi:hypothetical protein